MKPKQTKRRKARAQHPMQPVVMDGKVARFKQNKIVRFMLDANVVDMNRLACMDFSDEDRTQFAQLIGYSVSGAGDLSYFNRKILEEADKQVEQLLASTPRRRGRK